MEPLESFLKLMPIYLVSMLFLSYLFWSKFRNQGKLKIDKVNHILDITGIFIILTSGLTFLLLLLGLVNLILSVNLNLINLFQGWQYFILVCGFLLILTFLIYLRNRRSYVYLEAIFFSIILFQGLVISNFLGWTITIFRSPYNFFFISVFLFWLFAMILVLIINISIINVLVKGGYDNFFRKYSAISFSKFKMPANWYIFASLFVIVGSAFISTINIPKFHEGQMGITGSRIDLNPYGSTIFSQKYVNITIETFGTSQEVPVIPIYYGKYNFEKSAVNSPLLALGARRSNGDVIPIISDFDYALKNGKVEHDGFISVKIDQTNQYIFLEFDKNNISLKNITQLILSGSSKEINASKFNYSGNSICFNNTCMFTINVTNNIHNVNTDTYAVFNFQNAEGQISNKTNCRFKKIEFSNENNYKETNYCNGLDCKLFLYHDGKDWSFDFKTNLNENYISFHSFMSDPIKIDLKLTLVC